MTVTGCDTMVAPQLRALRKSCHGSLKVTRNGLTGKIRSYTVATGFGPGSRLGVYNNSINTAERAFTERYFLVKEGEGYRPALDVGEKAFANKHFNSFKDKVLEHMPHLPQWTREQVVAAYSGPKRVVYQHALESLAVDPLSERDAWLKAFVKFEKQNIGKAPRVINPRSPRYNLELGRFLKQSEHHFFNAINLAWKSHTTHTVIKGLNADKAAEVLRGKWDRFIDPVAIGLDATKFDMHVSQRALRYEHSFYTALFPGSKLLKKLLRWQLVNRGTARFVDGHLKFEMVGTRSSGDLNTSLGNCILMCGMIWAYCAQKQVVAELANNGDDCVVIMERKQMHKFMTGLDAWFRTRGFAMTVEDPVFEFEQIEFCQTRPVKLQSGWRMIRNHQAVLTKDPMCLIPIQNDKVYRKWLDAVGVCGLSGNTGCPVQEAFYTAMKRNAVGHECSEGMKERIFKNTSRRDQTEGVAKCEIDDEARASYCIAFGITPDEQLELEAYFSKLVLAEWGTQAIDREALDKVYEEHDHVFGRE